MISKPLLSLSVSCIALSLTVSLSGTALAQSADEQSDDIVLDTIIVTGQQVDRALEDTNASVLVFNPQAIRDGSANSILSVTERLPNVSTFAGDRGIAIRGVGQTGFGFGATNFPATRSPGDLVTTYLNGIPVSVFAGPKSFWDVEQVEVFRGTQSTTFGRGAPAGAVVIETASPERSAVHGSVRATVGTQNTQGASVALGSGLGDSAAFRLSLDYAKTDGFNENLTTGDAESADRLWQMGGKLDLQPSERFSILISALAWDRQVGTQFVDGGLYPDQRAVLSDVPDITDNFGGGLSARLSYKLNNTTRLESSTVFASENAERIFDIDQLSLPIASARFDDDIETISQEVRLHLEPTPQMSSFIGLYAEQFKGEAVVDAGPFGITAQDVDSTTYAIFGQTELQVTGALQATLGARFQTEESDIDVSDGATVVSGTSDSDAFLPKLALQLEIAPEVSLFAKAERGFRAGGAGGSILSGQAFEFGPEKTWNYDIGIRASFADGRGRLGATAFFVDYTDQQIEIPSGSGLPGDTIIANVGSSEQSGLEFEVDYQPTESLLLFGRLGLLDTEFTSENPNAAALLGQSFSYAPEAQVTVGADYQHASGLFAAGSVAHSFGYFSDPQNQAIDEVGDRTLVDIGLGYRNEDWTLALTATNLFDEEYLLQSSRAIVLLNPGGLVAPGAEQQIRLAITRNF